MMGLSQNAAIDFNQAGGAVPAAIADHIRSFEAQTANGGSCQNPSFAAGEPDGQQRAQSQSLKPVLADTDSGHCNAGF